MASSRNFAARLAAHLAVFGGALVAATLTAYGLEAPVAAGVMTLVAVGAGTATWRLVAQGNADAARFVAALDHGDFSQSFARTGAGSGFDRLGESYERAIRRLRDTRRDTARGAALAHALLDAVPVALLVVGPGDAVAPVNGAARRLFGDALTAIDGAARFGAGFATLLATLAPGSTRLGHVVAGGRSQRVLIDVTALDDGATRRRLVAVRIVQAELDQAELAAQVDLVRVLTHEIMNSLTPVVSLAATASALVDARAAHDPALGDAATAVGALARRAGELERFVESYKGFSEAPVPDLAPIDVAAWLRRVIGIHNASPAGSVIPATLVLDPDQPLLVGDQPLLTQVLLNLLKNAAEALEGVVEPRIVLRATMADHATLRLAVEDNGAGIAPALRHDVFLPFFTTKRRGSGIGLSLARQIVLLHGGRIGVADGAASQLELLLPVAP